MDAYIKSECFRRNQLPNLYGNKKHLSWILEKLSDLGCAVHNIIDVLVDTDRREIVDNVILIVLESPPKYKDVIRQITKLDQLIEMTKYTMPWRNDRNVYTNELTISHIQAHLIHCVQSDSITKICDMHIGWLNPNNIKYIEFSSEISFDVRKLLRNNLNDNDSSLNISFAYPWHQAWFECDPPLHRNINQADIFELMSLKLSIRNDRDFYIQLTDVIESRIDFRSKILNIFKYMFDCNKSDLSDEIILYFGHQFGRSFNKTEILHQFSRTKAFDKCFLQLTKCHDQIMHIQVDLAEYSYLTPNEIWSRLLNFERHFPYTINWSNYRNFDIEFFKELIELESVGTIYLDFSEMFDYFAANGNILIWDIIGNCARSDHPTEIYIVITPRINTRTAFYNRINNMNWISWIERGLQCHCVEFSFKLENFSLEDWDPFNYLYACKIKLINMDLNLIGLRKLAAIYIEEVHFIACPSLNETLLFEFVRACGRRIKRIIVWRQVTKLFYYTLADWRMREEGTNRCILKKMRPRVEVVPIEYFADFEYSIMDGKVVCTEDINNCSLHDDEPIEIS